MPELPPHVQARIEQREAQLQRVGFTSYSQYLSSSAWQAVKDRYRKSGRRLSCACGTTDVQMHHLTYARVGGDELLDDLLPLCNRCHQMIHALELRGDIKLDLTGFSYDEQRAAHYRKYLAAVEERREMKREAFHTLPLTERVRRLRLVDREHPNKIKRDLRAIEHQLAKAEAKVFYVEPPTADGRVRDIVQRLTTERPETLDLLLPEEPDAPIAAAPMERVADCDGSMTCECAKCEQDRAERVRMGVRSHATPANPLRVITRPNPRAPREITPPPPESRYAA